MPKSKEELAKIGSKTKFKTGKEQAKIARLGGIASQKVQHEKKTMKEMLDYLLAKEIKNKKGEKMTTLEAISTAMVAQAMQGNVKAYSTIRDTIGEKQPEIMSLQGDGVKIEVTPVQVDKTENTEKQ